MHPNQPLPSKPDLIVEVTELSKEPRNTLVELADQTRKFKEILSESDKAEGRESEVVSANDDLQKVLSRLNEIWDRARKPIIRLGKTSDYGDKLLSEFRCLPLRPEAFEVLKFVEFLQVVVGESVEVQADSGANLTTEQGSPDRQKLFDDWKARHPERGSLTGFLQRANVNVDPSDFRKWRKREKFGDDSEVSRRIIKALTD